MFPGEYFHDPSMDINHWYQVIALVDDNNLISSYEYKNSIKIFKDVMTKFTYWKDALQGTCGIINQEKKRLLMEMVDSKQTVEGSKHSYFTKQK